MDARTSYREVTVRGASPVRLVLCLYEQAIEDLRCAVLALEKGDIEGRTRAINHALSVIAQLQGSLDMERGGDVARNLDRFYGIVRRGLVEAQTKQSARIIEEQILQLATVHEAWLEVERVTRNPIARSGGILPTQPQPSTSPESPASDWNA